ncbi:ankyrin repeat domain-containing protein [Hymenobacter jeollabukensis]|nr:ankyrin repeat domain-containing protein [Hymenobacter jeollabukensis]
MLGARLFVSLFVVLLGYPAEGTAAQEPGIPSGARSGLSNNDSLRLAAATGDLALARRLLTRGAQVNDRYPDSVATEPGMILVLPGPRTARPGEAPLHVALSYDQVAMTKFLLDQGAWATLPGPGGVLPLALVFDAVPPHERALTRLLLACDVGPDPAVGQTWTPYLSRLIYHNFRRERSPGSGFGPRAMRRPPPGELLPARTDSASVALLDLLLAAGADPAEEDVNGMRPLHHAVTCGEMGMARYLVTHGAAVDAPNGEGATALHLAVRRRDVPLVRLLLRQGASMTAANWAGYNALHLAAETGLPETIALLLRAGAAPDARTASETSLYTEPRGFYPKRTDWHSTPLHCAAREGRAEAAGLLLAAGADPNAQDEQGRTPLGWALALQREDHTAENDGEARRNRWPGVARNTTKLVAALLAKGADASLPDQTGSTPLHAALWWYADTVLVRQLLAHGASPNATDHAGNTPAAQALEPLTLPVLQLLLAHGARLQGCGASPMLNGRVDKEVARACLAAGVSLLDQDEAGRTPLHVLLEGSDSLRLEVLELYLTHGARLEVADSAGFTPLARAAGRGELAPVQRLLAHGAAPNGKPKQPPLVQAAATGSEGAVRALLQAGAQPGRCATGGMSPLLAAVSSAYPSFAIVRSLLDAGADPNQANREGYTPLHWLVQHQADFLRQLTRSDQAQAEANFLAVAHLLIARGGRLDLRNATGASAAEVLAASQLPAFKSLRAALGEPMREPVAPTDLPSRVFRHSVPSGW